MICRADGVGPKLAQRIINELADKVSDLPPSSGGQGGISGGGGGNLGAGDPVLADAVSALVNLGYGRAEAHQVTAALISNMDNPGLEQVLPEALKRLAEGVRR
jgi:Holliday junction DNA helicase RuvA